MKHVTNQLKMIVIASLTALILIGCGGGTTASSTPSGASPATDATAVSVPTEQTAAGGATAPTASGAVLPTDAPAQNASPAPGDTPAASAESAAFATTKLNLNEVTEEQLLSTIPDFSNRMVREFFEYRPYISIQQFRREIGKYVSAEQVAAYEQYVYVPVDVDAADAMTLQQLPGIDASIADQLIADRPYGSNSTFLAKLGEYISADNVKLAEAYLAAK